MSEEKTPYGKPKTMDKILKFKVIHEDADVTILEGKSSRFYFDPNTKNGEEITDFLAGCEEVKEHSELQSVAEEMAEALESLLAEQNGAPLERYKKDWENAMNEAKSALEKFNKLKENDLPKN